MTGLHDLPWTSALLEYTAKAIVGLVDPLEGAHHFGKRFVGPSKVTTADNRINILSPSWFSIHSLNRVESRGPASDYRVSHSGIAGEANLSQLNFGKAEGDAGERIAKLPRWRRQEAM